MLRRLAAFVTVTAIALTAAGSPAEAATATNLSDPFTSLTAGKWLDDTVHGNWRSVYNGYGTNEIETMKDGNKVLQQRPQSSTRPDETHASLVVTAAHFGDSDITMRTMTVRQLRTPTPNPWETAWTVWNYTHDESFYYLALKTNGWELGKVDATRIDPAGPACYWPTYENCKYPGAQRFLATGTNYTFPVTYTWNKVRIRQVGGQIEAWANGKLLTRYLDTENVYRSGAVGLYNEDARVRFDDVVIRPAA